MRFAFARSILCVVAMAVSVSASAAPLTPDQKVADFEQVVAMMRAGYGPVVYKSSAMGLDLETLRKAYLPRIQATKTNGEFYYEIVRFVAAFKDSHFGARLPSTRTATLPFVVDLVDGRVMIDTVDRTLLPLATFPFDKGDEIVEFDGKPVQLVISELAASIGAGYDLTARRTAASILTIRPAAAVPVPTGKVKVAFQRVGSAIVETAELDWKVAGKGVDEMVRTGALVTHGLPTDYGMLSIRDDLQILLGDRLERSFRCSGGTRIAIPKDATIIMQSPFVAYYYPTAKGNVGYLRIPHYSPVNERTGQPEHDVRFHQYEYAVSVLEKNTVGLIIDQDHNCGGSVEWLNRMLGLFMDKEYPTMRFSLLANKQEYLDFTDWANQTASHTLAKANMEKVVNLIEASWKNGDFMTPITSIDGVDTMLPNAVRYTKPIVMLIDELSGSGGDAFPAAMGGLGRAKLLGTRTMGAGGHVTAQPLLNYSRISIRMTKSLFYRPDGVPVENNGAVPDYPYSPTRADFMYGYQEYRAFYTQKLLDLIP